MKDFVPEGNAQQPQTKQEKSMPTTTSQDAVEASSSKESTIESREPENQHPSSSGEPSSTNISSSSRILVSPAARVIAKDMEIELTDVRGTGPGQRITKSDILAYGKESRTAATQTESTSPYVDVPVSSVRRVIAQRLSESTSTIPHYYLSTSIDMSRVISLRNRLLLGREQVKLSINDFIVKAAAMACPKVPAVNSSWQGSFIRQHKHVDISVAVAAPDGLITPIIFKADSKTVSQISAEIKHLAERAREGKLKPAEFQGGTFTVSNLGMYGIDHFTAIINPPQSCILAVGRTEESNHHMTVTMSCDHRVVDGATGALWLQYFKKYLEDPAMMIVD